MRIKNVLFLYIILHRIFLEYNKRDEYNCIPSYSSASMNY